MREELGGREAKHSRRLVYILTGKPDRALKRAVNVPRRESINYEAMDIQRGTSDTSWNRQSRHWVTDITEEIREGKILSY